jgi:hypothetical protein
MPRLPAPSLDDENSILPSFGSGEGPSAVPAIDTHDHPMPFEMLRAPDRTDKGQGMTIHSLWQNSCYTWFNPLTPWPQSGRFEDWWPKAKEDFANDRATSCYRYQLPAFSDLYGVDFDTITDDQARAVNDRIFANYQDSRWFLDVVTNRANIELMLIDPYWARLKFHPGSSLDRRAGPLQHE